MSFMEPNRKLNNQAPIGLDRSSMASATEVHKPFFKALESCDSALRACSSVSLFKCKRESDWSVPCGCKTDILASLLAVNGGHSQCQRLPVFIATRPPQS